jgi:uncharacterized membrane protein
MNNRENKAEQTAKRLCTRWFIDAFSGMALGLFCTLIAGTILVTIGGWINKIGGGNVAGIWIMNIAKAAKTLMGAGIGVGIAVKLKTKSPLVVFSAAVAGLVGAFAVSNTGAFSIFDGSFAIKFGSCGNPISAYVVSLFCIEIASLYAGKTKLDIIIVPLGVMLLTMAAIFIAWPFVMLVYYIGVLIEKIIMLSEVAKYLMAILVAVVMGILLTMPTSSAAIWVSIVGAMTALDGSVPMALYIAGGAAVAGCSAHMVGFAVASFRENKVSGLISQGLGTSMLQIPNIMKKPQIMVPEIIASAVAGPVAVAFGLLCDAAGGGMGTSGLVGVIQTISVSMEYGVAPWRIGVGVTLCLFVIPAVVSFAVSEFMRRMKWIKFGDMQLD